VLHAPLPLNQFIIVFVIHQVNIAPSKIITKFRMSNKFSPEGSTQNRFAMSELNHVQAFLNWAGRTVALGSHVITNAIRFAMRVMNSAPIMLLF